MAIPPSIAGGICGGLAAALVLAVFAGTFAEGETVLVLAGLLAQQRRVSLPLS